MIYTSFPRLSIFEAGSFPDLIYVKTVDGATLRISAASFVL